MTTDSEFVGYIPPVTVWRIMCYHQQYLLVLEPDEYPADVNTIVSLHYDFEQRRHVGQCPDCAKWYYALVAESEPPR